MTARQWAQLMALGLALAVAVLVMVAVVLPAAALVMGLALLATGAAFVAQRASAVARAAQSAVRGAPSATGEAQPTLRLELASGEVVSARPVPLEGPSEHTLLLTRDGYVVVSAEGRVLHRL
jgi:type II secretory pathway pseudopilin PulG